jgi:hypothetical protein
MNEGDPLMDLTRTLRGLGATALLAVAADHLYEYYVDHYSAIPTIGLLFLLNAAAATILALALLAPLGRLAPPRLRTIALPATAAAGIGIASTSLAGLLVSEITPLFGFMEIGYRLVVVLAIVAGTASILLLGALLLTNRSTLRPHRHAGQDADPSGCAADRGSRTDEPRISDGRVLSEG